MTRAEVAVGRIMRERDAARAKVARLEAKVERLQGKLDEAARAIGLEPGGGEHGYLIPNLKALMTELDDYREADGAP